jgi:hypothetical protein
MSGSVKLAVYLFATVLALFFVWQLVKTVLALVSILVPILAVGGVVVLAFAVANRRGIGPGKRRILP